MGYVVQYTSESGKMPKEFLLENLHGKHYLVHFDINFRFVLNSVWGTRWRSWLRTMPQVGRTRVRFLMVLLGYLIDINIPAYCDLEVYPASNKNEHQGYFLGVKAAGA